MSRALLLTALICAAGPWTAARAQEAVGPPRQDAPAPEPAEPAAPSRELPEVAPPLSLDEPACEAAAKLVVLEPSSPTELPGLHNVYALSPRIISGGEPEGEAAMAEIAAMGVKTILSVDGKAPDVEAARKLGMRYVHVPIQYKGITADELLAIGKTFREAEGPFYVHCFHGKHRGPAAAAVGRLILDGISREQAIAEMRQWAGTSTKYEGLYRAVAEGAIPSARQTAALDIPLPEQAPLEGVGAFMVQVSRPFDALKEMQATEWKQPVGHPDLDPVNESAILASLLERASSMEELATRPDEFRAWIGDLVPATAALRDAMQAARDARTPEAWAQVDAAFASVSASCNACHKAYRDN